MASCRGAFNGLMAELIEGHLRFHVLVPDKKTLPSQLEAADELIAVVKTISQLNDQRTWRCMADDAQDMRHTQSIRPRRQRPASISPTADRSLQA